MEVIDFIKKLLVVDPKQRMSAAQALKHNWFTNLEAGFIKGQSNVLRNNTVLQRLKDFKGKSKLKKAAMNMLVKMADQKQIEQLRANFEDIDIDGTGLINAEEIK